MKITPDINNAILVSNRYAIAHHSAKLAINALKALKSSMYDGMIDSELMDDIDSAIIRMSDVETATHYSAMGNYIKNMPSDKQVTQKIVVGSNLIELTEIETIAVSQIRNGEDEAHDAERVRELISEKIEWDHFNTKKLIDGLIEKGVVEYESHGSGRTFQDWYTINP